MTREFLLKAAITEFRDLEHKVISVPFKRIYTDEGYCYLVLDRLNAKEITCAIHINREYVVTEEIGRLHTTTIDFSTREKIDIPNTLFIYKGMDAPKDEKRSTKSNCDISISDSDLIFFAKSFDGYNETMKQYMYSSEALTIDKKGLLEPLHDVYGYTSFDILSKIPNYKILPSYAYIEDDIHDGVIILNIDSAEPISMLGYHSSSKSYKQTIYEDISFNLVHISRIESARFVDALCNYSLESKQFGVCSTPKIEEFADLQESVALRGQAVKVSLRISYCRDISEIEKATRLIREVVWRMDEVVYNEIGIFNAKSE